MPFTVATPTGWILSTGVIYRVAHKKRAFDGEESLMGKKWIINPVTKAFMWKTTLQLHICKVSCG